MDKVKNSSKMRRQIMENLFDMSCIGICGPGLKDVNDRG